MMILISPIHLQLQAQTFVSENHTLKQAVLADEGGGGTPTFAGDTDFPVFTLPPMPRSFSVTQGNVSASTTANILTLATNDAFRVIASFDSNVDVVPPSLSPFGSTDGFHFMNVDYNITPGEAYGIYGTFARTAIGFNDPAAINSSSFELTIIDGSSGGGTVLYQAGTEIASPIGLAQGIATQNKIALKTVSTQAVSIAGIENASVAEKLDFEFEFLLGAGATQTNPLLPTGILGNVFTFQNTRSRRWVDPIIADGFRFEMTDGSLFTEILNFPTGFNDPFTVEVDGQVLGQFGPQDSVDFGAGVSAFTITGIDPSVTIGDPLAFPIRLDFDTETANFTMTAIPEPATAMLLLAIAPLFRRRRNAT